MPQLILRRMRLSSITEFGHISLDVKLHARGRPMLLGRPRHQLVSPSAAEYSVKCGQHETTVIEDRLPPFD